MNKDTTDLTNLRRLLPLSSGPKFDSVEDRKVIPLLPSIHLSEIKSLSLCPSLKSFLKRKKLQLFSPFLVSLLVRCSTVKYSLLCTYAQWRVRVQVSAGERLGVLRFDPFAFAHTVTHTPTHTHTSPYPGKRLWGRELTHIRCLPRSVPHPAGS